MIIIKQSYSLDYEFIEDRNFFFSIIQHIVGFVNAH